MPAIYNVTEIKTESHNTIDMFQMWHCYSYIKNYQSRRCQLFMFSMAASWLPSFDAKGIEKQYAKGVKEV